MLGDQDTIAAIGSARGLGALGIVRVSGVKTGQILSQCFKSKDFDFKNSHKAHFGLWVNPQTQEAVDEVVVVNFVGGRGFTGEDAIDIMCHGGVKVTELVLEATIVGGARLARPGEFTYRAVMNGKLDLTQAENILGIIEAKTSKAATLALQNIRGALSEQIVKIENELIYILAHLEASIDFTTEDIQPVSFSDMQTRVENTTLQIDRLLGTFIASQVTSHGVRTAFVGKPNAGKSSLMNSLLGKNRSIVTSQPGTTRDTIEAEFSLNGYLFKLIDTAGLRHSVDETEQQGIERTQAEILSADAVLYIVDGTVGLQNEDVEHLKTIGSERAVICFNKSDLVATAVENQIKKFGLNEYSVILTSAVLEAGVDSLRQKLLERLAHLTHGETASMVSTQRQKELLSSARENLLKAKALLSRQSSPEFVAFDLKEALMNIQELLGKSVGDDVMDRVFKEFCIGK